MPTSAALFNFRHELKVEDGLVEAINDRRFSQEVVRWKKFGRISVVKPDWTPSVEEKPQKTKSLVRF